jgi:hypothetical protein
LFIVLLININNQVLIDESKDLNWPVRSRFIVTQETTYYMLIKELI